MSVVNIRIVTLSESIRKEKFDVCLQCVDMEGRKCKSFSLLFNAKALKLVDKLFKAKNIISRPEGSFGVW